MHRPFRIELFQAYHKGVLQLHCTRHMEKCKSDGDIPRSFSSLLLLQSFSSQDFPPPEILFELFRDCRCDARAGGNDRLCCAFESQVISVEAWPGEGKSASYPISGFDQLALE